MHWGVDAFALVLLGCCVIPSARAQYEVEEQSSVWMRVLLDVRLVRAGPEPSWTDRGRGNLRYGGEIDGTSSTDRTQVALYELAIEMGAALPWNIRAQGQINIEPDVAGNYEPWLIEAILRKEWETQATGWGLQAGLSNVPFSLEHTGPAWTPQYALSASALNSWLWEEISLAGVEAEWWHEPKAGPRLGVTLGLGYGPDQMGKLLALRGWAVGGAPSGLNADLPLPDGSRMTVFHERDHRPAAYAWITLNDPQERGALKLGYMDNMGDQATPGVWRTRFGTIGSILHPLPSVDLVVQYLRGKALVGNTSNDSSLRAFYALLSKRYRSHRFTVRYDKFRVTDLDGGNVTSETGDAITVAYALELGLRQRIGIEYTSLSSDRPGSALAHLSQDGWQISYRFRY
jgi:hypothetical protein